MQRQKIKRKLHKDRSKDKDRKPETDRQKDQKATL